MGSTQVVFDDLFSAKLLSLDVNTNLPDEKQQQAMATTELPLIAMNSVPLFCSSRS
jgi:hypothetical protein